MPIFVLLSGLFCCLRFSGVIFFLFGQGRVVFFCCLGGGAGPAQTAKKKKHTPKQQKKQKNDPPLPSVLLFVLFGRVGVLCFCCLGGGGGGGGLFFFAVWAGGVLIFLLFGRGGVLFFCCLDGGREFTHLPVCLSCLQATQQQKRPNSKKQKLGLLIKGLGVWDINLGTHLGDKLLLFGYLEIRVTHKLHLEVYETQ